MLNRENFPCTHPELQAAGFVLQNELPTGTRYDHGTLLMRLSIWGTVRVFIPNHSNQIEISSGNIYSPEVHFQGEIVDLHQLIRFLEGITNQGDQKGLEGWH